MRASYTGTQVAGAARIDAHAARIDAHAAGMDPDALFDAMAAHLADTGSVEDAIDRLLGSGMRSQGLSFDGADAMADRVREAIRGLYDRYRLDRALEGGPGHGRGRHDEVERFRRHFGEQFRGAEAPAYDGVLDLVDRFTALRDLEKALRERDLAALDELATSGRADAAGLDVRTTSAALGEARRMLVDAGWIVERGGRASLTTGGARRLGALALREILSGLDPGAAGSHDTRRRGAGDACLEESRPWEAGDPMHLDAAATVRAALRRRAGEPCVAGVAGNEARTAAVRLAPGDLHVHETERSTQTSTVLLLDMSWSMSWEGRFAAARKVALALETLMRRRRPRDWFGIVGFYTRAVELRPRDLAEVTWNAGDPYTNLQDALGLGARLLDRHPAPTRQMLLVTDGQPTAYFQGGRLFCEFPMGAGVTASGAVTHTLAEVERVTRKGIRINTFMLGDDPNLRRFVQRMTAINRGRAFYTTPADLGRFVLVDHQGRRRRAM